MTHGSLFSGIGGFDLAAQWMGWENKFHCEWNPFGRRVLHYYWPDAESFEDITQSDFTPYANTIDVLTGGFPCQPYSSAGKRLGKEDERHLWPQMLRAIREIKPAWVVGENVYGLLNWSEGLVFHEVQTDLEEEGYSVQPCVLPACGVGAPHQRNRVWFVAHSAGAGKRELQATFTGQDRTGIRRQDTSGSESLTGNEITSNADSLQWNTQRQKGFNGRSRGNACSNTERTGSKGDVTNTSSSELQRGIQYGSPTSKGQAETESRQSSRPVCNFWQEFPTQHPVCGGNDGLSGRLDGITFSKWREETLKAYGNAIVPQVAYQIFKAIQQYEESL